VPVQLRVSAERLAPALEAAVYFVCSEALANVAKHANASRVGVRVERSEGLVVVEVSDDGVGGADPAGLGLRGLADRIQALQGRLRTESPPGEGTRLVGEVPLSQPDAMG
jgi:signal transduction histidine kinase